MGAESRDTLEIKALIYQKLGEKKADTYFVQLGKFLTSRITKSEFDMICIKTIGRENISLHNRLIRSILRNASVSKSPPPRYLKSYVYENSALPPVYRKCRSGRLKGRFSPISPLGKSITTTNDESMSKLQRRPVEDGEEVEKPTKSPGVQSRTPLTSPLGVSFDLKSNATKSTFDSSVFGNFNTCQSSSYLSGTCVQTPTPLTAPFGIAFNHRSIARKSTLDSSCSKGETCQSSGYLPDTATLKAWLEKKLEMQGIKLSMDSANLLNNGINAYIQRLIEPSLTLSNSQKPRVSMPNFRTSMELNPQILGENWPTQLEKICFRDWEDSEL